MNTSAHTRQNHDNTTTIALRTKGIGLLRRNIAGALLATALASTGIGLAATAYADDGAPAPSTDAAAAAPTPGANCKTDLWGPLGSWRRTLCDGPISHDGSWSRERTIWVPAHTTMRWCSSYGSDRYYLSCSGGNFVDQREVSRETYPVRAETVLPDEPRHLD